MKKIIDDMMVQPGGCETSKFPASFASIWMRIEGITSADQVGRWRFCPYMTDDFMCCGKCHGDGVKREVDWWSKCQERAHNLFAVVSGISLMQLDLSDPSQMEPWWGPNTNRLLDEYDDYVKFTMDFAGYAVKRYTKEADKTAVFDAIKRSIDADRPVLVNFAPYYDWYAVVGYDDETGRIYGYDRLQGQWAPFVASEGYEDGMFYLSDWYEHMAEAVVITGKTVPTVTYDDVFWRMIAILETMDKKELFKRSADYMRDDANFAGYSDDQYKALMERLVMYIGMPIDQRPVTSWCFGALAEDGALADRRQFFKRISALYDNTHDICWIAWRMVGAFGTAPADECISGLKLPVVRRAIAEIIDVVRSNDELAVRCLKEMMG